MLGHRLWINLQEKHDVYVTVRDQINPFPKLKEFPPEKVICGVEGLITEDVLEAIAKVKPEVVINCIGLIKQMKDEVPLHSLQINASLPHQIALWCQVANIRMIHISTDCVFSGNAGNYREEDASDADDLYGRTKFLGEVYYPHCVTLRTSIIGMELKNYLGLIEWFLRQEAPIRGYMKAYYTGFTTDELSKIIMNYVLPNPDLHGLYHVSSDTISKYQLLNLAKFYFKKTIGIQANIDFYCNRSLNSERFQVATQYYYPSWPEMIERLANTLPFYEQEETWEYGRLLARH